MDSQEHLDATTGREVVFCHACSNEWYRDEHGLRCPDCGGDITEIIDPENDPREELHHHHSTSTSPEVPPSRFDDHDSDPDEADIEEHLGPHGFHFRRSVRDGGPGHRHHDPAMEPVLERFLGMIHDFGPQQDFAPPRQAAANANPGLPRRPPGTAFLRQERGGRFAEPHVHRATFGGTSVTIFSGPDLFGAGPPAAGGRRGDPFQLLFSNVVRDVGPPEGQEHGGPGPASDFVRSLQGILNLFTNPANAVAGDAVYTQEALDRIITNLMDAHPQSNAAPPASTEALASLDRRRVEASMLEGESKTECAICIDDMKEGDTAAFLPCKHWFHEECVVLWLNEHNTCPVCRASIEGNNGGRSSSSSGAAAAGSASASGRGGGGGSGGGSGSGFGSSSSSSSNTRGSGAGPSRAEGESSSGMDPGGVSGSGPLPGAWPGRLSRPPSQSQTRLNEAMRSLSSQQEREREREWDRDREWSTSSGFSYDTSRLQRRSSRSSQSPTSPRVTSFADHVARIRQRSPSQSGRRGTGNGDSGRQSGSGALNWLRGQFSGRGGSFNQDASREER